MTIAIAQATMADIPELVALLSSLFAQEADFTPDLAKQQRGLQLIIGQPTVGQIYCARQADQVVGMVSLLFTISTAEGGRVAWLEDMVVHPAQRGRGIGEQLLHQALAEARVAGCSRITLLTDNTNQAAMKFYARAGFARSAMTPFRLHLPQD
ncbi:MAG: GNAT family N-acetyltransferase [Chloroflexi bacterium]|nr:GNAT family N-acetyltransferase [Chloroflexota bacterium]